MSSLFARCIPFDKNVKGRIGGNPLKCIEEKIPGDYRFYNTTLVHPDKRNMMLSVLVHGDFGIRIENNIYSSIAVKIIEHEYSEMGSDSNKAFVDLGINSRLYR